MFLKLIKKHFSHFPSENSVPILYCTFIFSLNSYSQIKIKKSYWFSNKKNSVNRRHCTEDAEEEETAVVEENSFINNGNFESEPNDLYPAVKIRNISKV